MAKRLKQKNKAVKEKEAVLSKPLKEAFINFLERHPTKRFRKNLRRMLIGYLMEDSGRESIYIYETLLDMDGLFELLDVVEEEWKPVVQS
jgi:hypothetical protein